MNSIKPVPFKFQKEIEIALFNLIYLGIKQYTTDGIYVHGFKLDLEHEYIIVEGWLTITRNRFTIYNERLSDVYFSAPSQLDPPIPD